MKKLFYLDLKKKYSQNHTSRISFLLQPPKGLFYLASAIYDSLMKTATK